MLILIWQVNEWSEFNSFANRRSAGMTNTDQFRVVECGTIVVESAEGDYDANNRGGDLRSLRSWPDRPPDLQRHTYHAQG